MQTKESFLKGRTTGFLIQSIRRFHENYYGIDETIEDSKYVKLWDANTKQHFVFTDAELRAELAKRPHLPNKLDRRKPKKKLSKSKTTQNQRTKERAERAYQLFLKR